MHFTVNEAFDLKTCEAAQFCKKKKKKPKKKEREKTTGGLPWGLSGKESTCNARGTGRSLVQKESTCRGTAEACAPQLSSLCLRAWQSQLLKPVRPHPTAREAGGEKPMHRS